MSTGGTAGAPSGPPGRRRPPDLRALRRRVRALTPLVGIATRTPDPLRGLGAALRRAHAEAGTALPYDITRALLAAFGAPGSDDDGTRTFEEAWALVRLLPQIDEALDPRGPTTVTADADLPPAVLTWTTEDLAVLARVAAGHRTLGRLVLDHPASTPALWLMLAQAEPGRWKHDLSRRAAAIAHAPTRAWLWERPSATVLEGMVRYAPPEDAARAFRRILLRQLPIAATLLRDPAVRPQLALLDPSELAPLLAAGGQGARAALAYYGAADPAVTAAT